MCDPSERWTLDESDWPLRICSVRSDGLDDAIVCTVPDEDDDTAIHFDPEDQLQRAILIASAPDLLAALRELQANPNDPRAHRTALDAIAEATRPVDGENGPFARRSLNG